LFGFLVFANIRCIAVTLRFSIGRSLSRLGDNAAGAASVASQRSAVLSNIYRELLPRRAIYTSPFAFAAMSSYMHPMTTTSSMAPRNITTIPNTGVVQSLTAG
jgi:hypothetical protein